MGVHRQALLEKQPVEMTGMRRESLGALIITVIILLAISLTSGEEQQLAEARQGPPTLQHREVRETKKGTKKVSKKNGQAKKRRKPKNRKLTKKSKKLQKNKKDSKKRRHQSKQEKKQKRKGNKWKQK